MKFVCSQTSLKKFTPLLGVVALSSVAFLGGAESARAAQCGPGDHWVDNCPAGVDEFPLSWAYLDVLIEGQANSIQLVLGGPATVTRQAPVDALINDPNFAGIDVGFGAGNVGLQNGHLGVIPTTLAESFTGNGFTLTGGGSGAIIEATEYGINRPDLAGSFFSVFATISGDFDGNPLTIEQGRNTTPIVVYGNKWLTGVSPNDPSVPPQSPPPAFPTALQPFTVAEKQACDTTDPLAVIIYCGFADVEFFLVDAQGNTTNQRVATLLSEAHVIHTPEPSAVLGSLFGLGAMLKLKRRRKYEV
jgi:hypothetical protein